MKVKDLIDILIDFPPEATVVAQSNNFELGGALVEASRPLLIEGKKEKQTFRDAYDGTVYKKEVWHSFVEPKNADGMIVVLK